MDHGQRLPKPTDQQDVADSSAMPGGEKAARRPAGGDQPPRELRGINPIDVESMPRAEDDDVTRANSPEYHDAELPPRPGGR
jgi:hypothetical protein